MYNQLRILASFVLIVFMIYEGQSQNKNHPTELINTWYAVKVGEPEGGDMKPTRIKEVFTFSKDGTMTIMADGGINLNAKWKYLKESETINVTLNLQGNERVVDLTIRQLTENILVLVSPDKATEYALSEPDYEAVKVKTAPLVVNSERTIDIQNWTGLDPFNYKITQTVDGTITQKEAIGVLILLKIDGNNIVRINEDGLTTDIKASEGQTINDEMHFNLITDDPNFSGKIVFRSDNSHYLILEETKARIEYIKQ